MHCVIIFTELVSRQSQSLHCSVRGTYVVPLNFSLVLILLASILGNDSISPQLNAPPPPSMAVQPNLAIISSEGPIKKQTNKYEKKGKTSLWLRFGVTLSSFLLDRLQKSAWVAERWSVSCPKIFFFQSASFCIIMECWIIFGTYSKAYFSNEACFATKNLTNTT